MRNTTQISQWESDVYTPGARRLSQIATVLATSPDWIISGNGNPPDVGRVGEPDDDEVFPISTLMRQPSIRAWINAFQSELIARGASPEIEDVAMRAVIDRDLIARFAGGDPDEHFIPEAVLRAMENIAVAARRFLLVEWVVKPYPENARPILLDPTLDRGLTPEEEARAIEDAETAKAERKRLERGRRPKGGS